MSFIILIALSLLFGFIAIVLLILAAIQLKFGNKQKNALYSVIGTIFSMLFSIASYMKIDVPKPTIFPLNNDIQTYIDSLPIEIMSDYDAVDIYYTLDGTDPKNGELCEGSITINESTTVCARSKFLWQWSDVVKQTYVFEKEQETQSQVITMESSDISEGLNPEEGYNLMTYINQYRVEAGLEELIWNHALELEASGLAVGYATNSVRMPSGYSHVIAKQFYYATSAESAVLSWMGLPSEAEYLLSEDVTQMGGALYYLPDGDDIFVCHYIWVVCLF